MTYQRRLNARRLKYQPPAMRTRAQPQLPSPLRGAARNARISTTPCAWLSNSTSCRTQNQRPMRSRLWQTNFRWRRRLFRCGFAIGDKRRNVCIPRPWGRVCPGEGFAWSDPSSFYNLQYIVCIVCCWLNYTQL